MKDSRSLARGTQSLLNERHDIIVIGASMGGFSALKQLISEFPANLPASIFVVLHIPADHESLLAHSFGFNAKLPVLSAVDGDLIKKATSTSRSRIFTCDSTAKKFR